MSAVVFPKDPNVLVSAGAGRLAPFSPFDGGLNANTLVLGTVGMTHMPHQLVHDCLAEAGVVAVLDTLGYYDKLCECVGGQVLQVQAGGPQGLDVLKAIRTQDRFEVYGDLAASLVCDLAEVQRTDVEGWAFVRKAIWRVWHFEPDKLDLTRVHAEMVALAAVGEGRLALAERLAPYLSGGEFGFLFEGDTLRVEQTHFLRFDLSALSGTALRVAGLAAQALTTMCWLPQHPAGTHKLLCVGAVSAATTQEHVLLLLPRCNAGLVFCCPVDERLEDAAPLLSYFDKALVLFMTLRCLEQVGQHLPLPARAWDHLQGQGGHNCLVRVGSQWQAGRVAPARLLSANPADQVYLFTGKTND